MQPAPDAAASPGLGLAVVLAFDLDFSTPQEKWRWQKNLVVSERKHLPQEGFVERLQTVTTPGSNEEVDCRRWKSDADFSVGRLLEQAVAACVSVQQAAACRE